MRLLREKSLAGYHKLTIFPVFYDIYHFKNISSSFGYSTNKHNSEFLYENVLNIETTADVLTALYDPTLKNHQYAAPNKFSSILSL